MVILFGYGCGKVNHYGTQLQEMLKLPNDEFMKTLGTDDQNKAQKIRELFEDRLPELIEMRKNFGKYVSEG